MKKQHTPARTDNEQTFFSPADLSYRWQVTGMTLRRWRKAGKLKALHIGRQIRFHISEIERFENEAAS